MNATTLSIDRTWADLPARPDERCEVGFVSEGSSVIVTVDAPFHGDPTPVQSGGALAPAGRFDGLWEHEVVELFLVGEDGAYLELEFGPHGHWLALLFSAPRVCVRRDLTIEVEYVAIDPAAGSDADTPRRRRWRGRYRIEQGDPSKRVVAANAFAIHGIGEKRRYLAARPLPGNAPDFHQPESFPRTRRLSN